MTQLSRRPLLHTALVAVLGGALILSTLTSPASAWAGHRNYLTFSKAVALPGVILPAGTYTFELANPETTGNVVRVSSRNGSRAHFMGFTQRTSRPASLRVDQAITFGEARAGEPPPIKAWYPIGEHMGLEFIYR